MIGWYMRAFKWSVFGLAVLLPAVALAESPAVATLRAASEQANDKVAAVLVQQNRGLGCDDLKVLRESTLTVLKEPFDAKGVAGAQWVVRYIVAACGQPDMRGVLFSADKGGKVAVEAMIPGETLTDPKLQADVVKSFALAVRKLLPQCSAVPSIVRTQVVFYPKDAKTRWREVWIGRACGHEVGQVVDFTPRKDGTVFSMNMPMKPLAPRAVSETETTK